MIELDADNVVEHLRGQGHLSPGVAAQASGLAWGVSNVVLRIESSGQDAFVVKQSRKQLRTKAAWFSRLDRIWREMEFMQAVGPLLPTGVVPRVLFADRQNYMFGMEAVDAEHRVWKADLLAGKIDLRIGVRLGKYLSTIHRETHLRPELCRPFAETTVFEELRVDPFYRYVAEQVPDLREPLRELCADMLSRPICLVHADFSPKNILITDNRYTRIEEQDARDAVVGQRDFPSQDDVGDHSNTNESLISLVDFETGVLADPAFDLGFFLSHLTLKAVLRTTEFEVFESLIRTFWESYKAGLGRLIEAGEFRLCDFEPRVVRHLAGCLLARIDGKSPVDYLDDPHKQQHVRQVAKRLLLTPDGDVMDAVGHLKSRAHSGNN